MKVDDLIVVDLSLSRGRGIEMVRRLRARCPDAGLIVVSVLDEPNVCRTVIDAGANGFMLKRMIATDLLAAVDAVRAGNVYVSPAIGKKPAEPTQRRDE